MKLKYRLCFILCMVFVITVSYHILQPDVTPNHLNEGEDHSDVQSIIEKYISLYELDWDTPVSDPWTLAASWSNNRTVHPEHAPQIGYILRTMSEARITAADVGYGGSQLKLTLMLQGGQMAAFKPKWYDRDYIVEGRPYEGRDRHNAEVLAFHLNRLLGYNRVPLTVGRTVDLVTEIKPVAQDRLLNTFFKKDGNECFYGKCLYCKSPKDGVCAEGSSLEGALILWLPSNKFEKWAHPWRRTYRDDRQMRWEYDDTYCGTVRQTWPYNTGPRLMDVLDAAVMDYLIGNADRHHYETYKDNNNSIIVMLDNAKSLGNPYKDEKSILAPLWQCCMVRHSTWQRLTELQHGVLTTVLDHLLSRDPIYPVVSKQHYVAMDRRLSHIVAMVNNCIATHGIDNVLVKDTPIPSKEKSLIYL